MCYRLNSNLRLVFQSLLPHLKHEVLRTSTVFTLRDRLSMYHQQLLPLIGHQPRCLRPPISAGRRLLRHPQIQR
jgi:hypothetical protein